MKRPAAQETRLLLGFRVRGLLGNARVRWGKYSNSCVGFQDASEENMFLGTLDSINHSS